MQNRALFYVLYDTADSRSFLYSQMPLFTDPICIRIPVSRLQLIIRPFHIFVIAGFGAAGIIIFLFFIGTSTYIEVYKSIIVKLSKFFMRVR